jgi:hypothetical protein
MVPYVLGGILHVVRKTTVYLPEDTERRIRRVAKRLGVSQAELTRTALEQYLDRSERGERLPPSVGMGENAKATAADYEERLARDWRGGRRERPR